MYFANFIISSIIYIKSSQVIEYADDWYISQHKLSRRFFLAIEKAADVVWLEFNEEKTYYLEINEIKTVLVKTPVYWQPPF